ncbi:MAG: ABC transporter permease [Labilithrix sp.]|nr:ABC transporter permease [Labilithrix sp.]MCW5814011.1 ABC transporter permease [Labilithrix sp.]
MKGLRIEPERAVPPVAALAAGWIAFCLLVWAYGASPASMAALLFEGTWGTSYGAGQVIFKATPLLFTGLAVDLALRGGLFNIGAEGQLMIASLAAGLVGSSLPAATPAVVALPLVIAAAMAAGGSWAYVPAVLKGRFGAHEVISTIMMNRIADGVIGLVLESGGFALPGTVRTADVVSGAQLPRLEVFWSAFRGSAANVTAFLALVAAGAMVVVHRRTRFGRELGLIGLGETAMRAEKVPVRRRLEQALVLSGAIAGAGCLGTVLGYKAYFEQGLGAGAGFGGLAVALLGRGSAVGLVLAALLFGTLQQGGLALNAHVPKELMDVLQGVVICAVALADTKLRAAVLARVRPA